LREGDESRGTRFSERHSAQKDAVGSLRRGHPSRVGDGADPTVMLDRTNPNRAAAESYARRILSIDLPLASSSTSLSR
jgi:hypothetical protein